MTRLTLSTASPLTAKADALVVAALQGSDGPVADDAAFVLPIEIGQDRLGDRRDVLLPLPECGQSDMKYV